MEQNVLKNFSFKIKQQIKKRKIKASNLIIEEYRIYSKISKAEKNIKIKTIKEA